MPRKKDYSSKEYSQVASILKKIGTVNQKLKADMEHPNNLDTTLDLLISKKYYAFGKKYGKRGIEALLSYHIDREEYEECAQIKKATE